MMTDRSLSVVIACYRDAGSVREFYRRLSEILPTVTPRYEIIYVNDASPDNAEAILKELAASDPHLVVVNHTRNFGSQNAFLSGMTVARGDGVVLMDGDLQDPPDLIPDLVNKWLEGNHIVYGVRVKRKESAFRQVAYKVFYRIFSWMARFKVPLDAGDFGLLDRRVVDVLLGEFPERLVFLRGLRAYTGFRHAGVEYVRQPRFDGITTNSLMNNIRWARLAVFSFSQKPLEYISVLAFVAVCLTGAATVFYLAAYCAAYVSGTYAAPPGYMTLLVVTLFLGSVQLVCFSILADYIGHIYDEVKGRPRFIVRDILDNRDPPPGGGIADGTPRNDAGRRI
ncbi:MAG TPA: glycosyltransferase family 2 protein [Candidatus Hydrogenedentes bacterium]|nr:glycosyltransferase family 2 protein [Candidatus Hydrogenedentota bacterium]